MALAVHTLYLIPCSRTDLGFRHEPAIAWELNDRSLDHAIELCEATAEMAPAAAFHWTVDYFCTLEHWWSYRSAAWHQRLLTAMERRQIAVGARYARSTQFPGAADHAWEFGRVRSWADEQGVTLANALYSGRHGCSTAAGNALLQHRIGGLFVDDGAVGEARPHGESPAWRWQPPAAPGELVIWHNPFATPLGERLPLDHLAEALPDTLDALLAELPEEYPLDIAAIPVYSGANARPVRTLSEQVRSYNSEGHDMKLVLTTIDGFLRQLNKERQRLPILRGAWEDAHAWRAAAMPQEQAAVRRAQRRLAAVDAIRALGWASVDGGTLSYNRARRHLALACEQSGGGDTRGVLPGQLEPLRRAAELRGNAWKADTVAMGLLRDHLRSTAGTRAVDEPSALLVNPFSRPLNFRAIYDLDALATVGDSLALDGESVQATMAAGRHGAMVPLEAETALLVPLEPVAVPQDDAGVSIDQVIELGDDALRVTVDPRDGGIVSVITTADDREWCLNDAFAMFAPVLERPQLSGGPPGDALPCRGDITFARQRAGRVVDIEWCSDARGDALIMHWADGPLRRQIVRFDPLLPGVLDLTAEFWLSADCEYRGLYLPFEFWLDPGEPVSFYFDDGGHWRKAGEQRLGGVQPVCTAAGAGIAVQQGEHSVTIASRDVALWQFGGYRCGGSGDASGRKPFAASWVYNNYAAVDSQPCAPGAFACRYLVMPSTEPASADLAGQLACQFSVDDLVHPLLPWGS